MATLWTDRVSFQVVVAAILHKMGHEGFEDHIRSIQEQYSRRAGLISAAASKHLKDLADWASVGAGMFMWLKLRGLEDTTELLGELESAKVIVVPGAASGTLPSISHAAL